MGIASAAIRGEGVRLVKVQLNFYETSSSVADAPATQISDVIDIFLPFS